MPTLVRVLLVVIAGSVGAVSGFPSTARADDPPPKAPQAPRSGSSETAPIDAVRAHVRSGDTYYNLGKFQEAIDEYSSAYKLKQLAPLLFNIGQSHKELKNYERAVYFYETYLREAPAATNRAVVMELVKESRAAWNIQKRCWGEASHDFLSRNRQLFPAPESPATVSKPRKPLYKKWWFWTALTGVAASSFAGGALLF